MDCTLIVWLMMYRDSQSRMERVGIYFTYVGDLTFCMVKLVQSWHVSKLLVVLSLYICVIYIHFLYFRCNKRVTTLWTDLQMCLIVWYFSTMAIFTPVRSQDFLVLMACFLFTFSLFFRLLECIGTTHSLYMCIVF